MADLDLDRYVIEAVYDRGNGVSSLGQGGLAQGSFEKVTCDDTFWKLLYQAIQLAKNTQCDKANVIYTKTIAWMEGFAKTQKINRFSAVVNRLFAGCLPGITTTVVAESHFWALRSLLRATELQELQGNWLEANCGMVGLLKEWLTRNQSNGVTGDNEFHKSIFFWWLYESGAGGCEDRQVIFYGSPGTGKTWKAKRIAEFRLRAWRETHRQGGNSSDEGETAIVQFHPSFGYEDFVEGIRPIGSNDGRIQLGLSDGVFKTFCRRAARWEIDYLKATNEPLTEETTIETIRKALKGCDPGSWAFLEGLPDLDIAIDHLPPYFFIVDEINRADLSRVLGELMYSLEYRGFKGRLETQYSALVKKEGDPGTFVFHEGRNFFFVPHNVFLFGTMNIIDRSVESFDFALRRRFRWDEVKFDPSAAREIMLSCGVDEKVVERSIDGLKNLNVQIQGHPYLGPDYCIGHAYVKHLNEYAGPGGAKEACEFLWQSRLLPLIREYLRGMGSTGRISSEIDKFRQSFLK